MKKEVVRMDIASRKRFPKEKLFRLVSADGVTRYDPTGSLLGRGFYLLRDAASLEKLVRNNLLAKLGKKPLQEGDLERMENAL